MAVRFVPLIFALSMISLVISQSFVPKIIDRSPGRTTMSPYLILGRNTIRAETNHFFTHQNSDDESGETSEKISTSQSDANKFVDELLAKLRAKIKAKGLDVLSLPSESKEFSRRVMGIRFHGEGRLANGTLTGLDSVHRVNEAEINSFSNGSLRLDFDTRMDELNIVYTFTIRFMGKTVQVFLKGNLDNVTVHTRLRVDPDGHLTLDLFEIQDLGRLEIETKGLGPFNAAAGSLIELVANGIKEEVADSIQGKIKTLLNILIAESEYPTRALLALTDMKESVFQRFLKLTKVSRGLFGIHN